MRTNPDVTSTSRLGLGGLIFVLRLVLGGQFLGSASFEEGGWFDSGSVVGSGMIHIHNMFVRTGGSGIGLPTRLWAGNGHAVRPLFLHHFRCAVHFFQHHCVDTTIRMLHSLVGKDLVDRIGRHCYRTLRKQYDVVHGDQLHVVAH